MINKMLNAILGRRDWDDRDHYGNKRMDLAGPLLGSLFRQLFAKLTKEVKKYLERRVAAGKEVNLAHGAIDASVIENGLNYSLATGNWTAQRKGTAAKTGVSQVLHRLTYASTLSHLRRLNTPIGRDGKLAAPRQLHNTHWGMVLRCPACKAFGVGSCVCSVYPVVSAACPYHLGIGNGWGWVFSGRAAGRERLVGL